ncbi:nitroreductase family protein [Alkalibacterium pelagium]|uniref:Nitroreductase n=1 Tax=Alkalibacterium pelagium TaxID=426702 RepID=A0A1H7NPP0_9LACT|nr:nitroreductase family protein [Alkalibacterium pelagium]GEN51411.1 hypothetical protein APE02nite_20760 [Alkalibacterium pelagium]SEL25510.1 Nitroreductase [Alkalibacterium pelagium]
MRKYVSKLIPQSVKDNKNLWLKNKEMERVINNDTNRFKKYSYVPGKLNYYQIEARLTKEYHSIEKGLSYNNLRLGFGKRVIDNIIALMKDYRKQGFPLNAHVYSTALSNLNNYIKIHKENNCDVSDLEEDFKILMEGSDLKDTGGVLHLSKEEILKKTKGDYKDFSQSRHSVRDYSEEPVSYEIIEDALQLATKTPSACNRQTWKVRIVEEQTLKKFIQKNQNGNRGFGDYIDKFIIITTDVQYYDRIRERNQANIDGGMYAMNLLYALHYYGIATVSLSASLTIEQENNLRNKFNISDAENFIMFIGLGHYTEEFKVPKSDRRKVQYEKF